jgi:hypothetical protein
MTDPTKCSEDTCPELSMDIEGVNPHTMCVYEDQNCKFKIGGDSGSNFF